MGYTMASEGDGIDISPRMIYHRGTVQKGMSQTIKTSCDVGVIEFGTTNMEERAKRLFNIYGEKYGTGFAGNVWDKEAISPNLMTMQGGNREPMVMENKQKVRIRKLTPRECWRLMGFKDEDFDKAKEVNSDTQLYKQAGNSIIVDVLCSIFKEML